MTEQQHRDNEVKHAVDDGTDPPQVDAPGGATQKTTEKIKDATAFWYDKQHRELLFYLSVAIFFLELGVGAVAFFYGVIHAEPGINGGPPRFQFPWLAYALAAIMVPAALLLIVHFAGAGLFRSLRGQEGNEAWQKDLPERLRKVYAIIQGAPTVVLLVALLAAGVGLFYLDGAMQALLRFGQTLEDYLPWVIGGVVTLACVGYVSKVWFRYRTERMQEEYAFRREVLERTGVIIVDRGSVQLPAGGGTFDPARAIEGASEQALPLGSVESHENTSENGPVVDVTVEKK